MEALDNAATKAKEHNDCIRSPLRISQNGIYDMTNDGTKNQPMSHTKAAVSLKLRFVDRIATMLSGANYGQYGVVVLLKEDAESGIIDLWICRSDEHNQHPHKNGDEAPALLKLTANILTLMEKYDELLDGDIARNAVRDAVFGSYQTRIREDLEDLRELFRKHDLEVKDIIGDLTGALDEFNSDRDDDLGMLIQTFWTKTCELSQKGYSPNIERSILQIAADILELPGSDSRLRSLLAKSSFSKQLYRLICRLSTPKLTLDTIIRFSRCFPSSSRARLHYGLPSLHTSTTSVRPSTFQLNPKSEHSMSCEGARTLLANAGAIFQPAPKQAQFENPITNIYSSQISENLVSDLKKTLDNKKNPAPGTELYMTFGYAVCLSQNEEQFLGYVYSEVLLNNSEKEAVFTQMCQDLQSGCLGEFLANYGNKSFDMELQQRVPDLQRYLATHPENRESVWRLVAFIRDRQDTNPEDCLIRDFGFHLCKTRENVAVLKNIYENMISRRHPLQVHDACIHGTLGELADDLCLNLDGAHRRMLHNQRAVPGIGFAKAEGEFLFKGGLFKRDRRK